jgi:hypothetical protein
MAQYGAYGHAVHRAAPALRLLTTAGTVQASATSKPATIVVKRLVVTLITTVKWCV